MKYVRLLATNLLVLFFALILLEVILWTIFPVVAEGTAITKVYKQNIRGVKETVTYKRNEFGLRSVSMTQYEKSQNLIRIFCTGASTTQQINQQTEDTWCGLLEIKLNEQFSDSGYRIETASYGGGGLRAISNALYIRDYIDKIDPDIIVTLLGINDLLLNGGPDYVYSSVVEAMRERSLSLTSVIHKYSQVRRRWHLIRLNRSIKSGKVAKDFYADLPLRRKEYHDLAFKPTLSRNPDPIDEFSEVISWIAGFVTEKETPLVFLGQPVLWGEEMSVAEDSALWMRAATPDGGVRPSGTWLVSEMNRYNRIQQQQALNYDTASYVDLDAVIPKNLDHYFDDCHFTDTGSVRVAVESMPTIIEVVKKIIAKRQMEK